MIGIKRQAALDEVKSAMGEGYTGTTSVGQTTERHPQSPGPSVSSSSPQKMLLTPEQKTMVESKRQVALYKVKHTQEGAAGATGASQTSDSSKTTLFPAQESVSVSAGLTTNAVCKNSHNELLFQAFVELSRFYKTVEHYNAAATYHKVSQAICDLTEAVTEDNALGMGKGKTKVPILARPRPRRCTSLSQLAA
jgi:hypothetical protein